MRVTGAAGAPVPSGPRTDHRRNTKASSRKGYGGGAHKQTQIMLRPTGQEPGSQQLIRKQSRGAVSRDPEDVLQALLVLERHQGQGGLGGASWDSLPSQGAAVFRVLQWGVVAAPIGTGCQSKQWPLWARLGPLARESGLCKEHRAGVARSFTATGRGLRIPKDRAGSAWQAATSAPCRRGSVPGGAEGFS